MKLPRRLEKDIQSDILRYLNLLPRSWWCRYNSGVAEGAKGGRYIKYNSQPGHPDIAGVLNGRSVFVEVKRPNKKPTALQSQCIEALERAGAVVIVATSIDDVQKGLRDAGLI